MNIYHALSFRKAVAMEGHAARNRPAWPDSRRLRSHPRALFSVPLTLQHLETGGVQTSHGISLDISERGIGALLQHTLSVGDTVGIELNFSDIPLNMVAIVNHSSGLHSGFEFVGLTAGERARLAGIVARL